MADRPEDREFEAMRRKVRANLNLDKRRASLGNSTGTVYVPGRPGYVYVREKQASGLGIPKEVRLHPNANVPINPGVAVLLGYDDDNELCVWQADFTGQLQQGANPWANNPLDPAFNFVNQISFMTLICHSTSPLSMSIMARPWIYIQNDIVYGFTGALVDLTSSVPSAGNHLLAGIFIKTDQTTEIALSTAQSILDPLDLTDVQECINGKSAGSTPCWFWRLYGGQTVVNDKVFPDGDSFLDGRQIINISATDHNSLSGLQGGTASQYYHLTQAGYDTLSPLANHVKLVDTATGPGLEVQKPDGSAFATIRSDLNTVIGPAGTARTMRGKTGTPSSSTSRWDIVPGDATAEGGSNAGSDLAIYRYDDSGVFIDSILTAYRSTGRFLFGQNVMGGAVDPHTFDARLTLTSATPVLTATVTGATTLYLALYGGDRVALWDSTLSVWSLITLTEKSIKATDTQTGTLNATTTVTGLTDTSQLVVGMQITGTNIPANTTIATIASATSITMNNAATGSGSSSLTFKLPPSTVYDVFCYLDTSYAPKLEFVAWSNSGAGTGARATALTKQNGVYAKTGDVTRRYVGTILTATTAGTIDHTFTATGGAGSAYPRLGVWNYYNRLPVKIWKKETTDTWTYNSATPRPMNGASSNVSNRIEQVVGLLEDGIRIDVSLSVVATGNGSAYLTLGSSDIGLNSTSAGSAIFKNEPAANTNGSTTFTSCATYTDFPPAIGYNFYQALEIARFAVATTFVGDAGITTIQSGIIGEVYA